MSKDIYQHFAVEDIPFIDKGLEWINQVEEQYAPVLTYFLNPHQVFILKTLGGNAGIRVYSSRILFLLNMQGLFLLQIISSPLF